MQSLVQKRGVANQFTIDSAGTASYHIGRLPDSRMIAAGQKRGLELKSIAKAFEAKFLEDRELIIPMDRENLRDILVLAKSSTPANVLLLSEFLDDSWPQDVPDPYYGGGAGFEYVLDMLEAACPRILDHCKLST
jgi:protein-tyrosine phosphatase